MSVMGFDPGKSGGWCFIGDDGETASGVMPVIGGVIDGRAIIRLLDEHRPAMVIVEKVTAMRGWGAGSAFNFGTGFGVLQGILQAGGYAYRLVSPTEWQKVVLKGTTKDKAAAIAFVHQAYPAVDLTPGLKKKPQDGIADAACLAEYGRQLHA